jgi:hypothetical protein
MKQSELSEYIKSQIESIDKSISKASYTAGNADWESITKMYQVKADLVKQLVIVEIEVF